MNPSHNRNWCCIPKTLIRYHTPTSRFPLKRGGTKIKKFVGCKFAYLCETDNTQTLICDLCLCHTNLRSQNYFCALTQTKLVIHFFRANTLHPTPDLINPARQCASPMAFSFSILPIGKQKIRGLGRSSPATGRTS
jgi:hypothetical protein